MSTRTTNRKAHTSEGDGKNSANLTGTRTAATKSGNGISLLGLMALVPLAMHLLISREQVAPPASPPAEPPKAAEPPSDPPKTPPASASDGKTFTQEDLDKIIATRLAAQRAQFDKTKADEKLAADGEWQKLAQSHEAENAKLKADLAKKDRDLIATKIAARYQLPETLAARLQGDDEAAIEADAKELAKLVVAAVVPLVVPPSSGSPANGARPNNGAPVKKEDLDSMTWQQIAKLKDEGKLSHLLGGQAR